MGEKGNISSTELVAAGSGAVVAGAGTQVTAVFEEAADTIKDKVLDKGADAGITAATDEWQRRRGDGSEDSAGPSTSG
ncbi:hypothetical protein ISU07_09740 [Nocardioides islandensis]|jgi:hypothetical protein|uniref:Uncharacterized protein n=1 Tax=Nocardioides islandensis TaxID=433663 RepID=A0A930YCP7_9ACTN|nr:hypothetical protein [Nocardioides islandensis]MBF4763406.1 hypothetical protein [Nocardioides islandensis]